MGSQQKPPGVPAEYVISPSGFFHPSCVVELADDEVLGNDLVIRGLDGSERDSVAPCAYPRYDFRGRTLSESFASVPSSESAPRLPAADPPANADAAAADPGWQGYPTGYTWSNAATVYATHLSVEWTVPPYPPNDRNPEIIYLWPGLVVTNSGLLQPVMGFVAGEWGISSWNCCIAGIGGNTAGVHVNPGDVIQGIVQGDTCDDSTGTCSNWTVTTTDTTCGQTQVLHTTAQPSGAPETIYPAVLETYGITSCDMFPANGEETFSNFTLLDGHGNPLALQYTGGISTNPSLPPCGWGYASPDPQTYTLIFGTSPTGNSGVIADPSCCLPEDNYLQSCQGCSSQVQASTCTLTCQACGTFTGTTDSATLDLPCKGTVSNDNGVLVCNASQGTGDAGADGSSGSLGSDAGMGSSGSGGSSGSTGSGGTSDSDASLGSSGSNGSSGAVGTGASTGASGRGADGSSGSLGSDAGMGSSGRGGSSGRSGSGGTSDSDASLGSSGSNGSSGAVGTGASAGASGPGAGATPGPSKQTADAGCGCHAAGDASGERSAPAPLIAVTASFLIALRRRRR